MIPLKDENPTTKAPVITIVLIAACVAIFVLVQPRDQGVEDAEFSFKNAAIPCEVVKGRPLSSEEVRDTVERGDQTACTSDPSSRATFPGKAVFLAVLYSMFLHGSWLHLGGNMLFLWVFGNNIEDKKGTVVYLVFYLLAGLAATAAHILVQPDSTVPVVGASGAIAGVMGAYLVLYPNVRIRSLIFLGFLVLFRDIAAKWLLGIWVVSQFFINPNEGVAWVAHVGGFVFGVAVGLFWRATGSPERELVFSDRPRY
ncbi:MAG: rhomboid family intramembrane serine protease [Actinobacteria bacterium]|nr:MAG: rhomboid family intramembrane serine protease [Actinomycetota bacterium]